MTKRARYKTGSVVFHRKSKRWMYLYYDSDSNRHTKMLGRFETKREALEAAEQFRLQLPQTEAPEPRNEASAPLVRDLVEAFRGERMPERFSTRTGYEVWFRLYIVPHWGDLSVTSLQARPVELWLHSLKDLAPKSKAHIRQLLRGLWEFSMWRGDVPTQRNPIELVKLSGTNRPAQVRKALTPEQFRKFCAQLRQPFNIMAVLAVSLGLRASELLGLRWDDIDWLQSAITIQRGIVRQRVGDTKTRESAQTLKVSADLLAVLGQWKQASQFSQAGDWLFASPVQLGRLPWSYPHIWRVFRKAANDAGLGTISPHILRHTCRAWASDLQASLEVQRQLMRHSDIRMTLAYGDRKMLDLMAEVSEKMAGLALNGLTAAIDGSCK